MDRSISSFKDILQDRRKEWSNFMWISRQLNPKLAYERLTKPTPKFHKLEVFKSRKIQDVIEKFSYENGALSNELTKDVWIILNEIGFNKRLTVIRWLGLLLTKICLKVYNGIHVNDKIYRIKELMGNKPIIFLPSHRSYADFILMSYLCFTYNIEIPAIAAGMDFHSMWGMGKMLRDTGAFFMRRSFNNDSLYWDTFRQYIYQLITEGDLPMEFFIEGTRSRTGKSLTPKFGLLSMILKTFYTAAVPDILFVPINISYDRVLEEKLFAYELLGVPKPKESTSGFFKSLSIIKERYGNIYIDFGEPISARSLLVSQIDRSFHNLKPTYMQEFTDKEKEVTSKLAIDIVNRQQKSAVITTFNLIALSLTNNFMEGSNKVHIKSHVDDVVWTNRIVKSLGACTDLVEPKQNIIDSLAVHKGLVEITSDENVVLVQNRITSTTSDPSILKGHTLSEETMTYAIPLIILQIYVNPVMHYLVDPGLISIIVEQHGKEELYTHYLFLQELFSYEFVSNHVGNYSNKCAMKEKDIMIAVQAQFEVLIKSRKKRVHPYSLNLDSITNSLMSMGAMGFIHKEKVENYCIWKGNVEKINTVADKIGVYLVPILTVQQINILLPSKL
ncbi:hypothetical protein FQR65_LT00770 [Abscondita terminalis]|nr:hypothetical protein FQR65_LT00770 [Abscondita terminalis]